MLRLTRISACFAGLLGFASAFIAAELPLGEPYNCSSFDTDGCWSRGQCVASTGQCYCDAGFAGVACEHAADRWCPNNCGGHGRCLTNGTCVCTPGYGGADCSEIVVPDCATGCSGRGACAGASGACACDAGYAGVDCSAVIPTCPLSCSARGRCVDGAARIDGSVGRCECDAGFGGAGCELAINPCPLGCSGRGACDHATQRCVCRPGFSGAACEVVATTTAACPHNCSAHGECAPAAGAGVGIVVDGIVKVAGGPSFCKCGASHGVAWMGAACEKLKPPRGCERGCSGRGHCVASRGNTFEGSCVCVRGAAGKWCEADAPCPGRCGGRGTCVQGRCRCDDGWGGEACDQPACDHDCSGHGTCHGSTGGRSLPACACDAGWTGLGCETALGGLDEAQSFLEAALRTANRLEHDAEKWEAIAAESREAERRRAGSLQPKSDE